MEEVQVGDVIQVTNYSNRWYPCLLIVDVVKAWGVQAYVLMHDGVANEVRAFYVRLAQGEYVRIGRAQIQAIRCAGHR